MATFIPGVTNTGNQQTLYNYNSQLTQQQLQQSDTNFEAGAAQVKGAYSSVLNSSLSVAGNIEARAQYMKSAREKLRGLSKVDLSDARNVKESTDVFSSFWKDDEMVHDATVTKLATEEIRRAEGLNKSSDDTERKRYWQTGLDYVNNSLVQLQRAKRGDGSIQAVKSRNYIDNYDTMGFLTERAGTAGLKIERSNSDGTYKLTTVNGDDAKPLAEDWVKAQLAGNQAALDVFRVQGTVAFDSKVNDLVARGYDVDQAKDQIAKASIENQKPFIQSSITRTSTNLAALTAGYNAKVAALDAKYPSGVITDPADEAIVTEIKNYRKALNDGNSALKTYKNTYDSYNNPDSELYREHYRSMVSNGEGVLAKLTQDQFIHNAANALLIKNSSTDYTLDPGAKQNQDIAAKYAQIQAKVNDNALDRQADQSTTNSTTASRGANQAATKAEADQATQDTPTSQRMTVNGTDPIGASTRALAVETQLVKDHFNDGAALMKEATHDDKNFKVTNKFIDNLQNAMTTGAYKDGAAYSSGEGLEELNRLKAAGIVPNNPDINLSQPTALNNALVDYCRTYYKESAKSGGFNPQANDILMGWDRRATTLTGLQNVRKEAEQKLVADPITSQLYSGGKLMSENDWVNKQFNSKTEEQVMQDYQKIHTELGSIDENWSYAATAVKYKIHNQFESARAAYRDIKARGQVKIDASMAPYMKDEGAYIGQTIRYSTDSKGQSDVAQKVATQALNPENLREQAVTSDGILPANYEEYKKEGVNLAQLAGFMQLYSRTIGDNGGVLSSVDMSKVGTNGSPSVWLNIDSKKLMAHYVTNGLKLDDKTVKAIASLGLEIKVGEHADIPELQKGFGKGALEDKLFDKYGSIESTKYVSDLGFHYKITKNENLKQYRIDFTVPQYNPTTGVLEQNIPMSIPAMPLNTSAAAIEAKLSQVIGEIIDKNNTIRVNMAKNAPKMPAGQGTNWQEFKKTLQ